MSTIHYSPAEIAHTIAPELLADCRRDVLGDGANDRQTVMLWLADLSVLDFAQANTRAVNARYNEKNAIPETVEQAVDVDELVAILRRKVRVDSDFVTRNALGFRYNLDDCATVGALEFCLWATTRKARALLAA